MFTRILFAHDGGMLAERALVYLEHIARIEKAEVVVLHVYQMPERYSATDGYDELCMRFESVAQEIVDDVVNTLKERDVLARGCALVGDTVGQVLEPGQQGDSSLNVIGSRGPSNMTELMLGNVSLEVLRYAHCPVLVVP